MKFGSLLNNMTSVMKILNDEKENFDDVLFYVRIDGKLHLVTCVELRYCEEIDKYAVIVGESNK